LDPSLRCKVDSNRLNQKRVCGNLLASVKRAAGWI
jgi:hypothetical protein